MSSAYVTCIHSLLFAAEKLSLLCEAYTLNITKSLQFELKANKWMGFLVFSSTVFVSYFSSYLASFTKNVLPAWYFYIVLGTRDLRNVQWRPFHPWVQTQVPFLHWPCSEHLLSHGNWSHRFPVQPGLQRHLPDSQTPLGPQSKLQTAVKGLYFC